MMKNEMFLKERIKRFISEKEQKRQQNVFEKEQSEIKGQISECIENWKTYQESIDMVDEDELICYFSYLIKAEEARLSFLQKQLG